MTDRNIITKYECYYCGIPLDFIHGSENHTGVFDYAAGTHIIEAGAIKIRLLAHNQCSKKGPIFLNDDEQIEYEKRATSIVRNFKIAKETTGKRHEYALFRLWRYLDVKEDKLVEFLKSEVPWSRYKDKGRLRDLFADITEQQCMKAESCTLKSLYQELSSGPPRCKFEGCDKLVLWNGSLQRYGKFCSWEHFFEDAEARWKVKSDKILGLIRSGEVEYQFQLKPIFGSKNITASYCQRLVNENKLTQERVFYKGHWCMRLRLAE